MKREESEPNGNSRIRKNDAMELSENIENQWIEIENLQQNKWENSAFFLSSLFRFRFSHTETVHYIHSHHMHHNDRFMCHNGQNGMMEHKEHTNLKSYENECTALVCMRKL